MTVRGVQQGVAWMLQCRKLATVGLHGSLHTHHHYLHDR